MVRTIVTGILAVFALSASASAQDAKETFRQAFSGSCYFDDDSSYEEAFPAQQWTLTWQEEYSESPSTATLYQFFCFAGAYNVNFVYMIETEYDGLIPLGFAAPYYDVKYVNDAYDDAVEDITVRGFTTQLMLTNSRFDPDTETIENHAFWRGLGDASSSGRWVFDKGQFVLKTYDVDASYDEEINPVRVIEYQ